MPSTEERLAQIESQLQYLLDRQAILDCISSNARGCDRHDVEMLAGSYCEDGIDEHGAKFVNAGPNYPEWANATHAASALQTMHNITTHSCDINGDEAHAESYSVGLFFNADGKTARVLAGRYLDRLVKEDGQWRIALRRCTLEVGLVGDAMIMNTDYLRDMGFLKGLRDHSDVSYQRPLTLDETPDNHRWSNPATEGQD
jgi:hypothetical protein